MGAGIPEVSLFSSTQLEVFLKNPIHPWHQAHAASIPLAMAGGSRQYSTDAAHLGDGRRVGLESTPAAEDGESGEAGEEGGGGLGDGGDGAIDKGGRKRDGSGGGIEGEVDEADHTRHARSARYAGVVTETKETKAVLGIPDCQEVGAALGPVCRSSEAAPIQESAGGWAEGSIRQASAGDDIRRCALIKEASIGRSHRDPTAPWSGWEKYSRAGKSGRGDKAPDASGREGISDREVRN